MDLTCNIIGHYYILSTEHEHMDQSSFTVPTRSTTHQKSRFGCNGCLNIAVRYLIMIIVVKYCVNILYYLWTEPQFRDVISEMFILLFPKLFPSKVYVPSFADIGLSRTVIVDTHSSIGVIFVLSRVLIPRTWLLNPWNFGLSKETNLKCVILVTFYLLFTKRSLWTFFNGLIASAICWFLETRVFHNTCW